MDMNVHIKWQLRKFGLYGLFKNLKFFDPFLWYYLTLNGLDLTKIGLLIAIREAMIYIFEIPSGVFADKFGKKNELVICFLFYIGAFILFFIGQYYFVFILAFILFGLGEAFRSGTHKAMIMEFLEYHNLKDDKAKVYGKTRSYSMIGSMISSLLAVIIILVVPNIRMLFLLSIIPYVLDLLLILSYPEYLNLTEDVKVTFKDFMKGISTVIVSTVRVKKNRDLLVDSATYNALFKTIKDYVQPILKTFMLGVILVTFLDQEKNLEVSLGLVYAVIFLLSAVASRFSYKFLELKSRDTILNLVWLISAIIYIILGYYVESFVVVIMLFIIIYLLQNIRKPIMVGKIGDQFSKESKASILSVESQITSLVIIILAPTLGLIYDNLGVQYVFYTLAIISFGLFVITLKKE